MYEILIIIILLFIAYMLFKIYNKTSDNSENILEDDEIEEEFEEDEDTEEEFEEDEDTEEELEEDEEIEEELEEDTEDEVEDIRHLFRDTSPLTDYTNYKVGNNGLHKKARRDCLLKVLEINIKNPNDYALDWGKPKSKKRIKALREHIRILHNNAINRPNQNLDEAIRNWEEDLDYIDDNF